MKYFVIGGTGYIGSVVRKRLLAQGHELIGLARSEEAAAKLNSAGEAVARGALGDEEILAKYARKTDGVIQIAMGGGSLRNAAAAADEAVRTTDALLGALEGTDKPYLFTCGLGLWMDTGIIDPERVVTENDPPEVPYFYRHIGDIYQKLVTTDRVRTIIVLPSIVYGRGGGPHGPIARMFDGARKHGVVHVALPGDNAYSYVHVDDLADLYVRALELPGARGAYFAVGDTVSALNVAKAVSVAIGQEGNVVPTDHGTLRRLISRAAEMDFWVNLRGSGDKARKELGWQPSRPGVVAELSSLPQPLDLNSVYPGRSTSA